MVSTNGSHSSNSQRVALAAAGCGAVLTGTLALVAPAETMASFADNSWASGGFSAGTFKIQSSLDPNDNFGDYEADPLELKGGATAVFSTPIALTPGSTSYAPVYLRTTSGTAKPAMVVMSAATKRSVGTSNAALWGSDIAPITPGLITYAARAVPTTSTATCNASVWGASPLGTELIAPNSALSAPPSASTFTLAPAAGSTQMVCFRFTLASNVASAPVGTNGASIYPVWTFTGSQQTP